MKTLECSRCHRLYRSTDDRMMVICEGKVTNYCRKCTTRLWVLADVGMRVAEIIEDDDDD